eukprot:jgi/Chlat1/1699/Chrsp127S01933
MLDEGERRSLALSTLAGLSTGLGGIIAVIRRPDDALLAFLLGTAVGVMLCISAVDLLIRNALENGVAAVCAAFISGAGFYIALSPYLPGGNGPGGASPRSGHSNSNAVAGGDGVDTPGSVVKGTSRNTARLLRLGLLMMLTMTAHNLPEGFAVAMASFTDVGGLMAFAVAVHNIPEGVVVAAPVFAATGSRKKALLMAFASGLSEPVGALIALLFVRPFLTPLRIQYLLGFVGGIMTAVSFVELLPEGLRCNNNRQLWKGVAVGAVIMTATLLYGA